VRLRKTNFGNLETIWRNLYKGNEFLTPYSSFEFNKIFYKTYRFGLRRAFFKAAFYEVIDNHENTIMIIPLFGNKNKYYIFGDLAGTGYLDFIYKRDCAYEDFDNAFKLLGNELKGSKLFLHKINEKSKLNDYAASNDAFRRNGRVDEDICVKISFDSDYGEYFKALSKSVRQNIRTSRNRLEREGLNYRLDIMIDEVIPSKLKDEMLKVYNQRIVEKYARSEVSIFIKAVRALAEATRRYVNPITVSTAKMNGNFNSMLHIDNSLVAFLSGYITDDDTTVIIPQHAMDSRYSRYGPGALLISETIKWLTQNTTIRNLDLSRGSEKYKYSLGGKEHYNYSYEIDL